MIAPALHAVTNCIDKFFIETYIAKDTENKEEVGSLILFSSLFTVFALPFILLFQPHVLNVSITSALTLILGGIITEIAIILYLYALEKDESSIVTPFFLLIPVFGYFLGFIFLGETLSLNQIFFSLLIILASALLSLDLTGAKVKLRGHVVLLMSGSSFLYALTYVIFKKMAIEDGYWLSSFWIFTGMLISGILIFIFKKNYRDDFIQVFRKYSGTIIFINFFSEIITIIADFIYFYSSLQAPIALVMMMNVFQPFFVFLYGIFLTLFFPHIATEKLSKKHLTQKIIAIATMMLGSFFLYY